MRKCFDSSQKTIMYSFLFFVCSIQSWQNLLSRSQLSVFLPSILHEKTLVKHSPWQRQMRGYYFPFPPRAAQAPPGLPSVHKGGGGHPRGPRVQSQVRWVQDRHQLCAQESSAEWFAQGAIELWMEERDRESIQQRFWNESWWSKDCLPESDLQMANVRLCILWSPSNLRSQLPRAFDCGN